MLAGTVDEAAKLRALCVSEMHKFWERPINSKGPPFLFWELCKRRFLFIGGRLDLHGFISFEDYVEWTGTYRAPISSRLQILFKPSAVLV